jgi:hypothetical protein
MMLRFTLVVAALLVNCGVLANLNARAWKSNTGVLTKDDFPEVDLLKSKPNTAIGFSGGGSRAYTAAIGYLAGLRDLDLLKNVRYIGGISGGGWATTTFTFVQNVTDDNVFLGKIVQPSHITSQGLRDMDPACARSLPYKEMTLIALQALKDKVVDSPAAAWSYAVSKTYLEPVGITPNQRFSWNGNTVSDIKTRNPALANEKFTVPKNANRPYPIIGTTLVGPIDGAPYTIKTQNYSMMEFTPLYVGQMKGLDIRYKYKDIALTHTRHIGGAIEPFAFARTGGAAPLLGLAKDKTTEILRVPEPENFLDLQWAAGAVSYAPGSFFESIGIPDAAAALSMQFNYWSPDEHVKPDFTTMMYADGGCYENIPLINFMQRRVKKIVLFFLSSTPLAPFEDWDVNTDPTASGKISNDFSAFFGVISQDARWENRSYELERDQVFATSNYATVVTGLQTAQQAGKGIFATYNLTSIENTWWGIPAGVNFEITFSYLGRLPQWEAQLSSDMYKLLVPSENAQDLSVDVDSGPFKKFPHFLTKGGGLDAEKANVLADLTGWSVVQNEDLFRHMLS